MKKFKIFSFLICFSLLTVGCQTVKEKTDAIVEKENKKLSEFIGKSSSELKIKLGNPDEDFKNSDGNIEFIYRTKKYGIPCERRFEINPRGVVIGFSSKNCF